MGARRKQRYGGRSLLGRFGIRVAQVVAVAVLVTGVLDTTPGVPVTAAHTSTSSR